MIDKLFNILIQYPRSQQAVYSGQNHLNTALQGLLKKKVAFLEDVFLFLVESFKKENDTKLTANSIDKMLNILKKYSATELIPIKKSACDWEINIIEELLSDNYDPPSHIRDQIDHCYILLLFYKFIAPIFINEERRTLVLIIKLDNSLQELLVLLGLNVPGIIKSAFEKRRIEKSIAVVKNKSLTGKQHTINAYESCPNIKNMGKNAKIERIHRALPCKPNSEKKVRSKSQIRRDLIEEGLY